MSPANGRSVDGLGGSNMDSDLGGRSQGSHFAASLNEVLHLGRNGMETWRLEGFGFGWRQIVRYKLRIDENLTA